MRRLLTVGGYGFTEDRFRSALLARGVDTVVDIRQRRGVRGRQYAFLNRTRLQGLLREAGISYIYAPEFAPSKVIRELQHVEDVQTRTRKRERTVLSPAFVERYRSEVLSKVNPEAFLARLPRAEAVALFCVETVPAACHRSLVANFLFEHSNLEVGVEHILP